MIGKKFLFVVKYNLWVGILLCIFLLNLENAFSTSDRVEKSEGTLRYRIKAEMVYTLPKQNSSEYEVKTCEINTVLKQIISKDVNEGTHIKNDFEDFTKKLFIGNELVETSYEKPASGEIWLDEKGNILKSINITGEFDFKNTLPSNLPDKLEIGNSWSSENEVELPEGFPKLVLKTICTPVKFQKIRDIDCVEIATETKGRQETKYKGIDTEIAAGYNGSVVCDRTGFLINTRTNGSLKIIGNDELILENYTEFTLERI